MAIPRILNKYRKEVIPVMREKFHYKTVMAVPKIVKIVLNVGVGRYVKDDKMLEVIERDLALISGQKPVPTFAKKSIASFKIRQGMKVGYKVTLRGKRMYDFIDRLISIAFPRTRDFQGLETGSLDAQGAFSVGLVEQSIFPEVHYESLREVFSLEATIVTQAKKRAEALELLKLIGFPFKKDKVKW